MKEPSLLIVLSEIIKRQQDTIDRMQATLDRIVAARYDRPIERSSVPTVTESMPQWAMNDQGDSRPDPNVQEIERQLGRIATATDAEWVNGE